MPPRKGIVGHLPAPGSRRWEHWRQIIAKLRAVELERVSDAEVRAALELEFRPRV
jgi:hypothetical protein